MNKVCFGCGSVLQSDNELEVGFIPKDKLDNSNYCKRCFRLTHYGDISVNETKKSTESILNNINKDSSFKIYMVDFLNINDSTIKLFNSIKGNKMLLISKLDLLDKSINKELLIKKIKDYYNIKDDIKFISSVNNYGIKSLLCYLSNNKISKVCLLGTTNCGKSTLINKLIFETNTKLNTLTTSNKKNTTLEFIRIKLNNGITLLDSPGFLINDYNLSSKYDNVITPITFVMKSGESLKIDNFYLRCLSNTSVTIYTYNKFDIHKYYKDVDFDYNISVNDNIDICITGFGFINIKSSSLIEFSNLDKSLISIRKSLFGWNNE